jgi:trk system potassium uptake protein TrkA
LRQREAALSFLLAMKIFVIGAGQVGSTIVESLYSEHDLTVVDIDEARLTALAYRFDVRTSVGNGASRGVLQAAGIGDADLVIACTSRDEPNLIAAMLARKLAPRARTIVRTTNVEYLDVWHAGQLDVDFIVSSELETALAVSRLIGVPAARQTDLFADGQVQIVEFDVEPDANAELVGRPLREARLPEDSRVASILRAGEIVPPLGRESIKIGDRVVVIGSPHAARQWSSLMARHARGRVDNIVIFGAGRIGRAVARVLLDQGVDVRLIEADRDRAREVAELLPEARVLHATGTDPEFLERERIGQAEAAVLAMREDAKNLYAGVLAKLHGVPLAIAVVHDTVSMEVFEAAGIQISLNPRSLTAEEIVRFAHDPRTQQVAMLEGDRYEILDITTRADSELIGKAFRELPMKGAMIGALIRDGKAIFPHGDEKLRAGDRAIVFTQTERAAEVERAL